MKNIGLLMVDVLTTIFPTTHSVIASELTLEEAIATVRRVGQYY